MPKSRAYIVDNYSFTTKEIELVSSFIGAPDNIFLQAARIYGKRVKYLIDFGSSNTLMIMSIVRTFNFLMQNQKVLRDEVLWVQL